MIDDDRKLCRLLNEYLTPFGYALTEPSGKRFGEPPINFGGRNSPLLLQAKGWPECPAMAIFSMALNSHMSSR
jgi:hypothetical protein